MNRNGRTACTAQRKATVLLTVANVAPRPRSDLQHRRQSSKLSRATGAGEAGAKNRRAAIDTRSQTDWNFSDRKRHQMMTMTQRAPVHGFAQSGKSDCCLCVTRVAFTGKTHATARKSGQINHFAARKKVENRYAKPIVIQTPKTARAKTGRRSTHQESGPGAQTTTGNAIEQMPEPDGTVRNKTRTKTRSGHPQNPKVEHKAKTLATKIANRNPEADQPDSRPTLACPNKGNLVQSDATEPESGTDPFVITRGLETHQSPAKNACTKGARPKALDGQKRKNMSAADRRYAAVKEPQDVRGATNTTNRGIVKRTKIAKIHPSQSTARLDEHQKPDLMADKRKPP